MKYYLYRTENFLYIILAYKKSYRWKPIPNDMRDWRRIKKPLDFEQLMKHGGEAREITKEEYFLECL